MKREKELLQMLKKELNELSHAQLATLIGYRSVGTILYWLERKEVPKSAMWRVERYFNRKESRKNEILN